MNKLSRRAAFLDFYPKRFESVVENRESEYG